MQDDDENTSSCSSSELADEQANPSNSSDASSELADKQANCSSTSGASSWSTSSWSEEDDEEDELKNIEFSPDKIAPSSPILRSLSNHNSTSRALFTETNVASQENPETSNEPGGSNNNIIPLRNVFVPPYQYQNLNLCYQQTIRCPSQPEYMVPIIPNAISIPRVVFQHIRQRHTVTPRVPMSAGQPIYTSPMVRPQVSRVQVYPQHQPNFGIDPTPLLFPRVFEGNMYFIGPFVAGNPPEILMQLPHTRI